MEENSNGFGGWRVNVFWLGIAAAAAIAGVVFGWEWRGRTGALADVSLLQVMTSFGTVGAVIAAVWLGLRDSYKARQERDEEAQVIRSVLAYEVKQFAFNLEQSYWVLSNFLAKEGEYLSGHDKAVLSRLERSADLPICKQQLSRLQRLPGSEGLAIATVLGKTDMIVSACREASWIAVVRSDPAYEFAISEVGDILKELSGVAHDLLPAVLEQTGTEFDDHANRLRLIIRKSAYQKAS